MGSEQERADRPRLSPTGGQVRQAGNKWAYRQLSKQSKATGGQVGEWARQEGKRATYQLKCGTKDIVTRQNYL